MANKLPIYQISLDPSLSEDGQDLGMTMVAYTSTPAIMTRGMAFDVVKSMVFADELKYRLAAPALIPDLPIYREDPELGAYEVVFSKEVIEKLRQDFMLNKSQAVFNLDHNSDNVAPSYILDSWITGPSESDPSFTKYGIKVPEGSWFIVSQFTDKDFFKNEIMGKDRVGYSIEGFLGLSLSKFSQQEFESYNDYPQEVSENAKIALRYAEENGWGDCGTPVGKARANQLANGENISRDTIARMAAFERQRQNSTRELGDGCGRLMWLAWGGDAGVEWAQRKLEQIDREQFENLQVYVVEPNAGETEDEFISRCIGEEINSGYPQDQAVAICYSKWKENKYNKETNKNEMKMKFEMTRLADGTPIYVSAFEVGGEVRVMDENGASVPVFDAEHVLENGDVVVTVDGKITEIKPKAEAELSDDVVEDVVTEDAIVEEEMAELPVDAPMPVIEPVIEPVAGEAATKEYVDGKLDELYKLIAELKTMVESDVEEDVQEAPMAPVNAQLALASFFKTLNY
jgi:hypothetical protein